MSKTSIVMCIYNGEKFIKEQIYSIFSQTLAPDEVLIFDDRSQDNTVDIIESFINQKKLANWKIFINPVRLGWKKNFIEGLKQAKGDIIFCCDQDDVWLDDKIKKMTDGMNQQNALVIGGCTKFIDEHNNIIQKYLGKMPLSNNTGNVLKIPFDYHCMNSFQPGCAICFSKRLLPLLSKYWAEYIPHDQLIWILGYLYDGAYSLDETVTLWRRHSESTFESMSHKRTSVTRYHKLKSSIKIVENISSILDNEEITHKNEKKDIVENLKKWLKMREALIKDKRLITLLSLIKYYKYYPQGILLVVDLYDTLFFKTHELSKKQ